MPCPVFRTRCYNVFWIVSFGGVVLSLAEAQDRARTLKG